MFSARTDASSRPSTGIEGRSGRIGRWARSAGIVLAAFAVAFAIDMATGQRYSQVLGSIAIVVSLLGVWGKARALAAPIAAYAGVWVGFNLLRAMGDEVPWRDRWLNVVPVFEARLFGGELPSIWFQRRLFDPLQITWFDQLWVIVYLSFFVVPHVVAAVLLFRNRDQFWRYVTSSALLFLIGAVSFALLPTNPPWLASSDDAGGMTLRLINFVLADAGLRGELPADGGAMANHHGFEPNPVATIPSIHLGVTALLVPLASGSFWRVLAVGYTLAMAFSLVYLGEHFVLDAVAGAVTAGLAWYAGVRLLLALKGDRRSVSPRSVPEPVIR